MADDNDDLMPERVYAAPGIPGWPGVWTEEREDDEAYAYIRADLVDELVKALEAIRRASALGDVVMSGPAASTSRFADIHQHADAALTRIKGDGK